MYSRQLHIVGTQFIASVKTAELLTFCMRYVGHHKWCPYEPLVVEAKSATSHPQPATSHT